MLTHLGLVLCLFIATVCTVFQTIMCSFCSWMVKHMITLVQVGLCGIWKMGCFPWNQALQQNSNLHHCIFTTLHYLLNLDKFLHLGLRSKGIKQLCTSTSITARPTMFLIGMRWVDWFFFYAKGYFSWSSAYTYMTQTRWASSCGGCYQLFARTRGDFAFSVAPKH